MYGFQPMLAGYYLFFITNDVGFFYINNLDHAKYQSPNFSPKKIGHVINFIVKVMLG
jgi:hypothetical protein